MKAATEMRRHNERLISDMEAMCRLLILGLFVGLVLFILIEALRGHHFWNKVKGEGNLWNYGSSLIYLFAGQVAALNAILTRYASGARRGGRRSRAWALWLAVAVAFAFFACDEMLAIHEQLGVMLERALPSLHGAPQGEGDGLIFAVYVLGSLAFSLVFLKKLPAGGESARYFVAGLVMVGIVGVFEVVPRDLYIGYLPFRETEELLEVFAGWAFSAAFMSSATRTLTEILAEAGPPRIARTSVEEVMSNAAG